jgi:hypothetical protein
MKMFFKFLDYKNTNAYIEKCSIFNIFTEDKKNKFSYSLKDNIPFIITIENELNSPKETYFNLFLIFRSAPKLYGDSYRIPCNKFLNNFNVLNNLVNLDTPYRYILIENSTEEILQSLTTKLYLNCHHKHIEKLDNIQINNYDYFFNNYVTGAGGLKIGKNFEENYQILVNISREIKKNYYVSIFSEFENNFGEMKKEDGIIMKQKSNDEILLTNFFPIKRVQLSPTAIKFQKSSPHQSSRFLRKYFLNDNFIKLEFIDENDCQLYTNNEKLKKLHILYKMAFENGIKFANKHYEFFLVTTNMMRANSVWMIDTDYLTDNNLTKQYFYNELGLNELLKDTSMKFAKIISRISQNFTTTTPFNNGLLSYSVDVMDDILTHDGKNNFSDGCGKISKDYLIEICNKINNGVLASAVQVRYQGAKGVLFIDEELKGRVVVLTKSMIKFNCQNSTDLEIIRFSKYAQGYLNLQIIILLILNGIKKYAILKFTKKEISNISKTSEKDFLHLMNEIKLTNNKTYSLHMDDNFLSQSARYCFIYQKLSTLAKKYRIKVKKSCFLIGVLDFKGILNEGEVFVQICKNGKKKVITGEMIVTKNPCVTFYDIQKVKAVKVGFFSEIIYNVIVFPCKGEMPIPAKITGSDLDGDVFWVCWDKSLTKIKQRDFRNKMQANTQKEIKINNNHHKDKDIFTIQPVPTQPTTPISCSISLMKKKRRIPEYKIKTQEFIPMNNYTFEQNTLELFNFYNKNYKLPAVSKSILMHFNNILKGNKFMDLDYNDFRLVEELAHHHSYEVDFQKTGETTIFSENELKISHFPSFLKKNKLKSQMNYFKKLSEIYFEFKMLKDNKEMACTCTSESRSRSVSSSVSDSSSWSGSKSVFPDIIISRAEFDDMPFFDFYLKMINNSNNNNQSTRLKDKHLKLFEFKEKKNDLITRSFIFKIYELISFDIYMHKAFILSLSVYTEEFFTEQKIYQKQFQFYYNNDNSTTLVFDSLIESDIMDVKNILGNFSREIKYIMMENDIIHEIELVSPLIDVISPNCEIYKSDIEEWRICLKQQLKIVIEKYVNELENINSNYKNVENILYILTYWIEGNCINLTLKNNNTINANEVANSEKILSTNIFDKYLKNNYPIKSKKDFIEDLGKITEPIKMKYFYFENIKIISLIDFYKKRQSIIH